MTLNDLGRQIIGFYAFLAISVCETMFQERIAPKAIDIDMEKSNEIFNIERWFRWWSKSRLSRFIEGIK